MPHRLPELITVFGLPADDARVRHGDVAKCQRRASLASRSVAGDLVTIWLYARWRSEQPFRLAQYTPILTCSAVGPCGRNAPAPYLFEIRASRCPVPAEIAGAVGRIGRPVSSGDRLRDAVEFLVGVERIDASPRRRLPAAIDDSAAFLISNAIAT
jgi:hypothetical protein